MRVSHACICALRLGPCLHLHHPAKVGIVVVRQARHPLGGTIKGTGCPSQRQSISSEAGLRMVASANIVT